MNQTGGNMNKVIINNQELNMEMLNDYIYR